MGLESFFAQAGSRAPQFAPTGMRSQEEQVGGMGTALLGEGQSILLHPSCNG